MIGQIWKVRYVDSMCAYVHGEFYDTRIIYIPELNAEINTKTVRETCDKHLREPINGVRPEMVGEIEIDDDDAENIRIILNANTIKEDLIQKYAEGITNET